MEERFSYLFDQFAKRQATPSEREEFFAQVSSGEYDAYLQQLMRDTYEQDNLADLPDDQIGDWYLPGADQRIVAAVFSSRPTATVDKKAYFTRLWSRIAAAAAILLVVGAACYLYIAQSNNSLLNTVAYNDIAPGRNSATLTLGNGRKILLSAVTQGELAKDAGVSITKDAEGQISYEIKEIPFAKGRAAEDGEMGETNTLSTANGQTYQVRLPDGTAVWLNAASSITYPVSFNTHKGRQVQLNGEAYFEVAKDKAQPFIVQSAGQEVEVLGTHFNINSYADESSIRTTLLEGAVKVTNLKSKTSNFLKPNQQAILTGANQIEVRDLDAQTSISWKKGEFTFDREEISSIMRKVARWYNVQVVYKDNLNGVKLTGSVSRFENISKLLKMLENTEEVNFEIDGNKVVVKR
ncbi:FecR family protein [Pedobacter sp. ok626]|uniref:FecR family protein n=1 Tax=Pedobacter sp. ok626 TaxID=1761882 RepID=UPI000885E4AB|nr:FecR domain-containing protein [Pedobacter sp. ok626]SDL29750.1 FecR family protein [Pedobacter sp. ok626]